MKNKAQTVLCMAMLLMATMLVACGGDDASDGGGGSGSSTTITVSQSDIAVTATGGTFTVNVTCTGREWSAYSDNEWLKVTVEGSTSQTGSITLTASANKGAARTAIVTVKSGTARKMITVTQSESLQVSAQEVYSASVGESITVEISCGGNWTATADVDWLSTQQNGKILTITTAANDAKTPRTGMVTVTADGETAVITVTQESAEDRDIVTPDGYRLVWHDEFNEGDQLNSSYWEWENWERGNVNNELQYYRPGTQTIDGKHTTELVDGRLVINCFKANDGKIYSGRVNAKNGGNGWQYGYFEARILLPKGKGTWPAYWMMPISVDWATEGWPKCGEIDIMEEVGVDANVVSSSLHSEGHNHMYNTQITAARNIGTAESEYHVYALEWTTDYIKTYVDGQLLLSYNSDHTIRNFPYDKPFHLILNLAWGGDWGGYAGTDESALPVQMKIDYVRVFQKK